jgi:hypothetical protein
MNMRKVLNLAAAAMCLAASGLVATEASAQYYYDQYGRVIHSQPQPRVYQNPYGYQQPQYVSPRVARKQAQLQERFVEKYGYPQPQRYRYVQPPAQYHYGPRRGGVYYYQ